VSLVPTQLHRILADRDATAAAGTFDAVLIGGAAAAPGLLSRARASGIPVVTTYGMSETCGGCVYDGRPLPGVTARIEDDGRILLTGPVVARGYRGRPGDPAFPAPGAFRTEDRGVLDAEGLLTVHGRVDDVIVSGGTKVAPNALEDRLSALPGIGQAVVVGVPDAEWGQATAALVTADGTAPDLGSVRDALADLPAAWRPRHLIVVPEIPLLGIGKPDRTAAAALAAAHVLGREASSGNVQGQIEADDARPSARP
jgi:O-succinylbenzoic acid--CoA ligase